MLFAGLCMGGGVRSHGVVGDWACEGVCGCKQAPTLVAAVLLHRWHPHVDTHALVCPLAPHRASTGALLWARRLTAQLAAPATMYLWDHIVAGRSILPGAAMLEMALAAGRALGAADWAPLAVSDPPLTRIWTSSWAHHRVQAPA